MQQQHPSVAGLIAQLRSDLLDRFGQWREIARLAGVAHRTVSGLARDDVETTITAVIAIERALHQVPRRPKSKARLRAEARRARQAAAETAQ